MRQAECLLQASACRLPPVSTAVMCVLLIPLLCLHTTTCLTHPPAAVPPPCLPQVSPDRVLTISGERSSEMRSRSEEEGTMRLERSFGSFTRRLRLPDGVDVDGEWGGRARVRLRHLHTGQCGVGPCILCRVAQGALKC